MRVIVGAMRLYVGENVESLHEDVFKLAWLQGRPAVMKYYSY